MEIQFDLKTAFLFTQLLQLKGNQPASSYTYWSTTFYEKRNAFVCVKALTQRSSKSLDCC